MGYPNHKPLPALTKSDIERFWKFVDKRGPKECWPWMGGRHHVGNYGHFWLAGKTVIASRVAFFLKHGHDCYPLLACHSCDNEPCCNGDHIYAGTNSQNSIDAWNRTVKPSRGENIPAANKNIRTPVVPVMPRTEASEPEKWKDIVGHEGRYEISSYGRVKVLWSRKVMYVGAIRKPGRVNGYLNMCLTKNGIEVTKLVHCLVAEAFLGPSNGRQVNHKDGYKDNPILDNLEYLTDLGNRLHAQYVLKNLPAGLRNGKYTMPESTPRGISHGMAKLNEDAVRDIRRRYSTKSVSGRQLAADYGVDKYTIYAIINGRTWKHIK